MKFKYHCDNVLDSDSDILSFNGPTIDVTVEANVPSDTVFVAPATELTSGGTWVYKRVFLKEQHLHVRWFPTQSADVAPKGSGLVIAPLPKG
jgi:hypothetical protein